MSWLQDLSETFRGLADRYYGVADEIPLVELKTLYEGVEQLEDRLDFAWRHSGRWPKSGESEPVRNGRRSVPALRRLEVLARDGYRCQRCRRDIDEIAALHLRLEIDHIVPVSKGGGNEISNLQVLCQECNQAKRDTVPGDR